MRHFISTALAVFTLGLLPSGGSPLAQEQGTADEVSALAARFTAPDAATYGTRLEAGDLAQLRRWLDAGLDPDYFADRIGTGLMIAAWRGDVPMMQLLVERGADINKANKLGERALMHAAWRGQSAAARWLIERGAQVNSASMQWSALHYAAFAGQAETTALLLERGADINARSVNGSSPLMMAVYEGHEGLVRQLLASGADTNVKNDRGDGALEWAFKFQRLAIARLVAEPQAFAAAANRPRTQWGEPVRSQPAPASGPPPAEAGDESMEKIRELVRMRNTLAERGMKAAALKLDRRIADLRAKRVRANRDVPPVSVFEISASRAAPEDQRSRLIFEGDGPPP